MIVRNKIPEAVPEDEVRRLWEARSGDEEFLQRLRDAGASKIESIRALRRSSGRSLDQAKDAVHTSLVWADARNGDDAFHELVAQALDGRVADLPAHKRLAS